ncbi:hypothetical protein OQA88_10824 [Cercophora sp. LCS_1]
MLLVGAILLLIFLYRSWARLAHVPGPFLASISNIPRLLWVWSGSAHDIHINLHKSDPHEMQKIYGTGANMQKSEFYGVFQPVVKGKVIPGLFNSLDESVHRAMKRPIAGIYSMTNLVEFEPYVENTIKFFLSRLDEKYVGSDKPCNIGDWLQWLAFDVMGEITFSKRLGFLDEEKDVEGIIHQIWDMSLYAACVGQIPWADKFLLKNPLLRWLRPEKVAPIPAFALARARERANVSEDEKADTIYNSKDFMSRFIEARSKNPSIPESYITAWATSNINAGSDTTAIYLRAIVYYLNKHPAAQDKLMTELALARRDGRLSEIVTWKESRELPYLDACVKEAGRLYPAVGLTMERVVPKGGIQLCGTRLEEGTVVGMSGWVVHRDRGIFGADADEFNPERWLVDKDKRATMERCLLTVRFASLRKLR